MDTECGGNMDDIVVRLAGKLAVLRDDVWHAGGEIGSRKARRLLALLAARRGHLVSVSEIVDVLWVGQPPQRPADNVATLVSRLRARLAPAVVVGDREGYRLGDPQAVRVDLDDAAALVAEATRRLAAGVPGLAASAAQAVMTMLGDGSLLSGEPDASWLTQARAEAVVLLRTARHCAADAVA